MDTPSISNQPPTGSKSALWAVLAVIVIVAIAAGVYFLSRSTTNTNNSNGNTNTVVNQNANSSANANTASNVNVTSNSNAVTNTNLTSNKNTTVDTSGWKTYEDSRYGFSIKYPSAWTYQLYTNGYNGEGNYVIAFTTNRSDSERLPFLSVRDNWSEAQETEKINQADPPFTKVTLAESVTLGSLQARRLIYDSTIGLTFRKDLVARGSTLFIFDSLKDDAEFEQVASTLTSNN